MIPGDADRLAALLGGADPGAARAALSRAAGRELSRLAYVVLQQRFAAELAAAGAVTAAVRRAETAGWRPTGPELHERLLTDALADALRRYDGTREVDPLAARRPNALPAEADARAVVAGVLVAGLPVAAAARAAGMRAARAHRVLREAVDLAGSEDRLRDVVAGQLASLALSAPPVEVEDLATLPTLPLRRRAARPLAVVAGVALAAVLLVLSSTPRPDEATGGAPASDAAAAIVRGAPPVVTEAGVLPTLETCGIGPPDAPLAYAGWLTVEDLGVAPPDAGPGARFYALVPAGDVAWNPPGLSRRIMPAVRGRLACLSTARGLPPTVVGLTAGWTPPTIPRHQLFTIAECGIRPSDARIAYRGWLTAEQLGEPVPRPLYAIVTQRRVSLVGDAPRPSGPTRELRARYACVIDPDADEAHAVVLPDA